MSVDTWGTLPKAQDDPTTIDDAIAAAILAHDNASSSHLSSGASLQNHRQNEVLDHPLASVVADKLTQSEFFFETNFPNLGAFAHQGTLTYEFPGFYMEPSGTGSTHWGVLTLLPSDTDFNLDLSKDALLQIVGVFGTYGGGKIVVEFGWSYVGLTEDGFGLEIINSVAKFYAAKEDGSSKLYLAWPSYNDDTPYVIRIQYVASEQKAYFYINGELLGTLSAPDPTASDPLSVMIAVSKDSGGTPYMRFNSVAFALPSI